MAAARDGTTVLELLLGDLALSEERHEFANCGLTFVAGFLDAGRKFVESSRDVTSS